MRSTIVFLSLFFMVLSTPLYSQTGNRFSAYLTGGEAIFKNQDYFKDRYNFSPAAGLDLHLKRFSLGLEGSVLNARFIDLMSADNMGNYVPDFSGSNKYQSIHLLFGPGFDVISTKKFNVNLSGRAGLNFVKEEKSAVNLTIPVNPTGLKNPVYQLAQREPLDAKPYKLFFSPSMTFTYQAGKNVAVILKTSYLMKDKSSYSYSRVDLSAVNWTKDPKIILEYFLMHKPEYETVEEDLSNFFVGIGLNFTLWSKDKPIKQKGTEKVKKKDCPTDTTICVDQEDFTLSGGSPSGGVYSGKGVKYGVFRPAVADTGTHLIKYVPPGKYNPCTFYITVKARPVLKCPSDTVVSFDSGEFKLKGGDPGVAEYTGKGVSEGKFNPAAAGGGAHKILYRYKKEGSCEDTCAFTIYVMKYFYELSKDPSEGYVEISGDSLNIQFSNSYASEDKIYMSILDVGSQKPVEQKITKIPDKPDKRVSTPYNINGLNRISIGLKNYALLPGKFYQLTISDAKNYYYLNFKIIQPRTTPGNIDIKDDIIK